MQEIKWKFGSPVSDEVVRAAESQLGVVFPSDYRTLVGQHNGGRPKPNAVEIPGRREAVMERLVRLDACAGDDVASAVAVLRGRGQGNLVPFASDPFGNLFCFQFARKVQSAVVFWEHETGSVSAICKTFSDLLALLRPPLR